VENRFLARALRCSTTVVACATLATVAVAGPAAAGGGGGGGKSGTKTIRFVSPDVAPSFVDLGEPGRSVGDLTIFDGTVLDGKGEQEVGHYYGTQVTVAVADTQVVQSMITYDLGDDDSLLFGGIGEYPAEGGGLVKGQRFTRPVLGGTGRYAGATGTVTTIRRDDGSYEQRFRIET
jgi:hypothetical protein